MPPFDDSILTFPISLWQDTLYTTSKRLRYDFVQIPNKANGSEDLKHIYSSNFWNLENEGVVNAIKNRTSTLEFRLIPSGLEALLPSQFQIET